MSISLTCVCIEVRWISTTHCTQNLFGNIDTTDTTHYFVVVVDRPFTLFLHGQLDTTVPFTSSKELAELLLSKGSAGVETCFPLEVCILMIIGHLYHWRHSFSITSHSDCFLLLCLYRMSSICHEQYGHVDPILHMTVGDNTTKTFTSIRDFYNKHLGQTNDHSQTNNPTPSLRSKLWPEIVLLDI